MYGGRGQKVFHGGSHHPSNRPPSAESHLFPKKNLRNINYLKLDLVQLCETQRFKFVLYGNIIFETLEQSSFQKYATCWVFLALRHMLYLYIGVFVILYLCVRHMGI